MKIEIKHIFDSSNILVCGEYESIKECLEKNVALKKDLRGADLSGADLRGAYLSGADLSGAYLRGAYLSGAYLRGADLSGAYLRGADLSGADLSGAYLSGADLRGADLRGADLSGAYLRGADLRGAYLSGAYLRGEKLTKEPLMLTGLKYFIIIAAEKIHIGCEVHEADEWAKFEDSTIEAMDTGALEWWKTWKPAIMALHAEHAKK
jgi:uncharacterized protein YjbI with pentapeptide repeats